MCNRAVFKGDLSTLLRNLPEREMIEQYLKAGGAFYFDSEGQGTRRDSIELFFYLFDATHYFYVQSSEVEIEN